MTRFSAALFICSILIAPFADPTPAQAETRVIDGDTLHLNGITYRLNGIDAPEHGQTCGAWRCGEDATQALADSVAGKSVTCEPISKDGYGRVIATCYADGQDLGAAMIDKGLAWAFLQYSDAYAPGQLVSQSKAQGVFADDFMPPWEFRRNRWASAERAEDTAPPGCPIKGNISKNGRIYHAPWSPWYGRTRINISKGERWFCTEAQAIAAGWRAPYWN